MNFSSDSNSLRQWEQAGPQVGPHGRLNATQRLTSVQLVQPDPNHMLQTYNLVSVHKTLLLIPKPTPPHQKNSATLEVHFFHLLHRGGGGDLALRVSQSIPTKPSLCEAPPNKLSYFPPRRSAQIAARAARRLIDCLISVGGSDMGGGVYLEHSAEKLG